jgi:hypothetical protein
MARAALAPVISQIMASPTSHVLMPGRRQPVAVLPDRRRAAWICRWGLPSSPGAMTPHASRLMRTVDWRQQRLWRTLVRSTWTSHFLAVPSVPNQDSMPHIYALLFAKALDALRHLVTMFQAYYKEPDQLTFT